ncbi:MAG: carotenoid biosynthesis protein [Deltaproteobacteria bacterium]|nr:carotenoid biosynthesis protein [Deltaproteobacteria bacterium]
MLNFLMLLAGTVALRPYVFIFLGAYLLLATLHLGAGRAVSFLVLGYLISWAAEVCAINFGFPFGEYLYIPATLNLALWVAGVPLMDSLSYVFLAYASYCLALTALDPGRGGQIREDRSLQRSLRTLILGAVLMVTIDIIIDPVALRGYRWFLGQIYGYPEGGVYFGVPISNFAGWLLVALILIRLLQYLISRPSPARFWDWGRRPFLPPALLGSGLYLGILGFNLTMTFLIGETCLGWVGVFIYLPFLTWLLLKLLP